MKKMMTVVVTLVAVAANAENATHTELKKAFGVVPAAARLFPESGVEAMWQSLAATELSDKTALSGKTKELIGLAVASTIPCRYCAYFHQEAAKLNGANEKELREAIAAGGIARFWTTVTFGVGDMPAGMPKAGSVSPEVMATYEEIAKMFGGNLPATYRNYPAAGITPAWNQTKQVLMTNGALTAKDKALVALAVSAAAPSEACSKAYSMVAKSAGATDQELQEAVAISALTREGSTVLNGALVDEAAFRKEVDGIIKTVKKNIEKQQLSAR